MEDPTTSKDDGRLLEAVAGVAAAMTLEEGHGQHSSTRYRYTDTEDDPTTSRTESRTRYRGRRVWLLLLLMMIVVVVVIGVVSTGVQNRNRNRDKQMVYNNNNNNAKVHVDNSVSTSLATFAVTADTNSTETNDTVSPSSSSSTHHSNDTSHHHHNSSNNDDNGVGLHTTLYSSCHDTALFQTLKLVFRSVAQRFIRDNVQYVNEVSSYPETESPNDPLLVRHRRRQSSVTTSTGGAGGGTIRVTEGDMVQQQQQQQHPTSSSRQNHHVFAVYGDDIVVVDVETMKEVNRIALPTTTIIDHCYASYTASILSVDATSSSNTTGLVVMAGSSCNGTTNVYNNQILFYDTTNIANITLRSTHTLAGFYVTAWMVDDSTLHVVTTNTLDMGRLTQFLDPTYLESLQQPSSTKEEDSNSTAPTSTTTTSEVSPWNATIYRKKAHEMLELKLDPFVKYILDTALDCNYGWQEISWLQDETKSSSSNTNADVANTYFQEVLATVSTFAISNKDITLTKKNVSNILLPWSNAWHVKKSDQHLIVFCDDFSTQDTTNETPPRTFIVVFQINGFSVRAVSVGTVSGIVHGPSSMDIVETNGTSTIRTLSSIDPPVQFDEEGNYVVVSTVPSTVQLSVFEISSDGSNGELPLVGQSEFVVKAGQTIATVQFDGDRGFVASSGSTAGTFYTMDLTDPTQPVAVAGELEIPGFYANLYPVDKNLIIGIGRAIDNATQLPSIFQLSLVDVSVVDRPRQIHHWEEISQINHTITSNVYSEAEFNMNAIRFLKGRNLFVLPLNVYWNFISPCDTEDGDDFYASNVTDDRSNDENPLHAMDVRCKSSDLVNHRFEGFRVMKIDAVHGISEYFSIAHGWVDYALDRHYLTARSLISEGSIVTMKGRTVGKHNLTTMMELAKPIDLK